MISEQLNKSEITSKAPVSLILIEQEQCIYTHRYFTLRWSIKRYHLASECLAVPSPRRFLNWLSSMGSITFLNLEMLSQHV